MPAVVFSLRCSILLTAACLFQPSLQNTNYVDINGNVVSESVQECHLSGDSDLYGLGIRIAFYLQWGMMIIALLNGLEEEIASIRRGFNFISIAVFISATLNASKGSFAALEMFIVSALILSQSLYFAMPFGSGPNEWYSESRLPSDLAPKYFVRKCEWLCFDALSADPFGIAILLLVDSAFLLSQPWLYFKGFAQGNNTACKPMVWVFTSISMNSRGWIIFLQVFSVIFGVLFGTILAFFAGWIMCRAARSRKMEEQRKAAGPSWRRVYICLQHNSVRLGMTVFQPFLIAFVEKTIKVNHIDMRSAPLSSTGQLLPLVVAGLTLVSLVMDTYGKWQREKRERAESTQGIQNSVTDSH